MKFNSQICTTRVQSERLLALGLKKKTADMMYMQIDGYWVCVISQGDEEYIPYEDHLPAWSLHRLLEMCTIGMRVPSMRLYVKDVYDNVIGYIEELIRLKSFSKEFLEE